jgi:hypothetical protein
MSKITITLPEEVVKRVRDEGGAVQVIYNGDVCTESEGLKFYVNGHEVHYSGIDLAMKAARDKHFENQRTSKTGHNFDDTFTAGWRAAVRYFSGT